MARREVGGAAAEEVELGEEACSGLSNGGGGREALVSVDT